MVNQVCNKWMYKDSPVECSPLNMVGFVYIITNRLNGRYYIGKKSTISGVDWHSYYGSNKELKVDIKKHGKENFSREILYWCTSKKQMTSLETKEQFLQGVLESELSYNNNILGKFFRKDFMP